jgi:hypothetical protein
MEGPVSAKRASAPGKKKRERERDRKNTTIIEAVEEEMVVRFGGGGRMRVGKLCGDGWGRSMLRWSLLRLSQWR